MVQSHLQFRDRFDAGRQLATKLVALTLEQPVVYALPRGGVPIALEISRALQAPLDLLLVRKIGAPGTPEVALGAVVEGSGAETVINEEVRMATGADDTYLERARQRELVELERRRALYLGSRARLKPAGRTAIVVDDGLATGATAKAALIAIKNQGAAKVVLAVPVAPEATLAEMRPYADIIVCLHPVRAFPGVGAFYSDFHQLTDEETIGLLRQGWVRGGTTGSAHSRRSILVPPLGLVGDLSVPLDPRGIILFAHGSGSSRLSPRNAAVADRLNDKGFATLLLDLLTADEAKDRRNVFDIPLLAERLLEAAIWIQAEPDIADLPLGLFGASTGAGAAMLAAAELQGRVAAVVSRGGRPDLAGPRLAEVEAPTLLIVGGDDREVLTLNQKALHALACEKLLKIVPGATHLFEEPGALEAVTDLASAWFEHYLLKPNQPPTSATPQSISQTSAVAVLRTAAEPLPSLEDANFAAVFDRFAQARVILLGEASHGTSEFYLARAAITRRLIERHGFTIVAVEADWPDAAAIDRYVRQSPHRPMHSTPFARFPTWMWRNKDVDAFISFLRNHNAKKLQGEKVGFYGLDLYNMTASIAAVLAYLDRVDPEAAQIARERYACLSPWSREPAAYGRASLTEGYALCERPVTRILIDLLQKELQYAKNDGAEFFDAMQNARLVADAERYYRAMYYGARESWNHRDQHMFNALQNILAWTGPKAKAVVWAHNSHIGDARFTEMGMERGELNIGQLCRQAYGRDAALIGFGTHSGTVAAASEWDGPMEIKAIRPSRPGSYEDLFHKVGADRFLVDFRAKEHDNLRRVIAAPRLERYIGVIYRPETERWSHYSYASLSDQYDAFVWFDQSCAVIPLPTELAAGEDETYPFGL
ncbi:erythromycin esterase [Rhizobium lentis]|uniref:erythromycin esterase family protein n=1 Tax=Rhizobium lentis TaxID=1138194 RepID=UPI001C83498E|nr:erythromycin esterase family protein [Rhizobium lentis]MBX5041362.1 erythromycin esterase [Rhizobium lentis]MBX5051963.1 erythromycin esterase [Rhizobium lentis]MBX5071619.1 erythromycin esterase [Rhizobium lentis]MBX5108343.1 erythromycin esterase [Rhizobium lentis]MBX5117421.1 erythromycin esterase [Rhizobium lentis]